MDKIKKHKKLKGLMAENNKGQEDMAKYLDITLKSFNQKVNGTYDFKETEINKILRLFNVKYEDIFLPYKLT